MGNPATLRRIVSVLLMAYPGAPPGHRDIRNEATRGRSRRVSMPGGGRIDQGLILKLLDPELVDAGRGLYLLQRHDACVYVSTARPGRLGLCHGGLPRRY